MTLSEVAARLAEHLQRDLCRHKGLGWFVSHRSDIFSFGNGWISFYVPDRVYEADQHVTASLVNEQDLVDGTVSASGDTGFTAMQICNMDDVKPVADFIAGLARKVPKRTGQ